MMVEHVRPVGEMLDQAAKSLHEVSQTSPGKPVTPQNLKNLIGVLQECNDHLPSSLQDKSLGGDISQQLKKSIENAIGAVLIFKGNQTLGTAAAEKNVSQAIVGLWSALNNEVKKFDKNLRDLGKYRIGQRVEKTNKSKES